MAEGGAHTECRAHQVGHRLAHYAQALQEVQRAFLGQRLLLALVEVSVLEGRTLLGMIEQVPRAVGEVGGGPAQREQGQVQVASGFGESMEEQPQLKHGVTWR